MGDGTGCDNMTAVLVKLRPAFENKPETGPDPVEAAAPAESSSTDTKPEGSAASSAESTATSSNKREATEEGEEEQSAEQQQPAKKLKVDHEETPSQPEDAASKSS